jgi:hypothetical protein
VPCSPPAPSFAAWLSSEPAFERIRSAPEFQALLKTN